MKCFVIWLSGCLWLNAQAAVPIQHWETEAGARVYFVPTHHLPMIDARVDFAAGSSFDPQDKSGVALLTAALLDLGAGNMDETGIAERLADAGAQLSSGVGKDRASVSLRTLSLAEHREPALAVMQQVLQSPRFEKKVVQRERERAVSGLKDSLSRPATLAARAFWRELYPRHPYGRQHTVESLSSIDREDLLSFYRRYYRANNATVSLVGDLSRAEAELVARRLTDGLAARQLNKPGNSTAPAFVSDDPLTTLPGQVNSGEHFIAHPAEQAHILLGLPAVVKGSPDYYALLLGNYTLGGGGFVSRLMREVREKRGLAYSVYSYFSTLREPGPFRIGLQTKKSQTREALTVVRKVLEAFIATGPKADELKAAKANIIGGFPLGLDSNAKLLANVATIGFYGLPLDYLDTFQDKLRAVSADEVRRAFARYVRPEALAVIVVGISASDKP